MQPLFINSSAGRLFAMYWPAVGETKTRGIVHVPAFAEEMNKSRRMVALQARAFAEQGISVLVIDLMGTGDSDGEFVDATWLLWRDNIATAMSWLREQGVQSVDLWGLRLGALLAMDYAAQPGSDIQRILAWQPVLNGDAFITQFLRLRVAAAMMNPNAPQEKTSDLKRQLIEGQACEVAGYTINPDLIRPLLALRASALHMHKLNSFSLCEVVANQNDAGLVPNQHFIEQMQSQGVKTSLELAMGDSFWTTQEITVAPQLIQCSCEMVRQWQ